MKNTEKEFFVKLKKLCEEHKIHQIHGATLQSLDNKNNYYTFDYMDEKIFLSEKSYKQQVI